MKHLLARLERLEARARSRASPPYIVTLHDDETPKQAYRRYVETYGTPGHMIVMLPPDLTDEEWERKNGTE